MGSVTYSGVNTSNPSLGDFWQRFSRLDSLPLDGGGNSVRHNSCGGGVRRSRYTIDSYATCTDAYPSCKTEGHRHGALPSALAVRGDPPRVQIFSPAGPAL